MSVVDVITRFKPTNPLLLRLFYGAKWGVVGAIFSRALALILSIVIARLLKAELFGQFLIIQSTLGMFGVFAGLGLGVVATKFTAELRQRDAERLGRILELVRLTAISGSITIAAICALLAPVIAEDVFHRPELTIYVRIMSAAVVFLTWDGYNTATLYGLEYIKQSVQSTLFSTLLSIPAGAFLTWQFGLAGAVYGVLMSSILQCVVSFIVLRKALSDENINYRRPTRSEWRVLYQYALPSLLAGTMVLPIHWLCQAMLAGTLNGMVQVAAFGIGLQWFQLVFFLPVALNRVILPIVTDMIAGDNAKHSAPILRASILANAAVSLPVAIAVSALSETIMALYNVSVPYGALALTLIVAASTISAVCSPIGQLMIAKGQVWYGLGMNLGWAVVYLSLSWALLGWGAVGVAVALLCAYLMHSIWVSLWAWQSLKSRAV